MEKIIEIPDLSKELQEKLIISLMVFEANFKDDNIVPLLRPELMIKQNKLIDASIRLEEIIKKILKIIMHGKNCLLFISIEGL